MANKYRFDRDSITVNGKKFPARYEVMDYDTTRGDYYTVVIYATVDGGQEQRIEVPAGDKQHGAALAAAQMDAGSLADLATDAAQVQPEPAAVDAAQDGQQASSTAADAAQVQPEPAAVDAAQDGQQASSTAADAAQDSTQDAPTAAQIEKEGQTMKRDSMRIYNAYFTDYPTQAVTIHAANKRDAEKQARQYIRQWGLDAKIDRVECVPPLERREGWTRPEYRQDGQQASSAATDAAQVQPEPAAVDAAQDGQQASSAPADAAQVQPEPAAVDAAQDGQQASDAATDAAQVQPEPAAVDAAQDGQQASSAPADPKATRGPVPEKTFINEVIAGKGWSIVFDAGCNRTRVIIAEPVKAAARPIVEAAGFYYSRQLDSWNKKLTFRAYRAANALADKLRAALA